MRILQIEKFMDSGGAIAGGVGRYVRTLGEHLRRRGHDVLTFGCVGPEGSAEMPSFFDFTATRSPLAVFRMINNREAAEKLDIFLQANPADVAHVHNIYHHLTPSIFPVLLRHGVGIVMTVHDYRLACPTKYFLRDDGVCTRCIGNRFWHAVSPRCAGLGGLALAIESWWNLLHKRYSGFVDSFFCPTEYMCDVLKKTGISDEKILLLRNLVNFPMAEPAEVSTDGYVLFAGRVSAEKSPGMMIDLAARLPDVKVVIAGDGPFMPTLRERAEQAGLDNLKLLGHVAMEEMSDVYAGASVVAITSRWMENSPASMLEAMAAGRVVVAADHPPLREWINDGVTGRLFKSENVDQFAQAVGDVLANPAEAIRMAQQGRELVLTRHDSENIVDLIEESYQKAMRQCGLR
jgi:glycosyltransferase involved in cell wall biosynthesis